MMSEDEIKELEIQTKIIIEEGLDSDDNIQSILQKWLDLYQKEKEKNKELTIKNHLIKNESNAYGEEIVRLDNQLKAKNQEIEYLNCIIESDKDNYINKGRIKEKIKELEDIKSAESIEGTLEGIKLLEELLEGNNGK